MTAVVHLVRIVRRAVAADLWPWTWSLILAVIGLQLPASAAPWTLAVGLTGAAWAIQIPARATRERVQVASISVAAVGALAALGWSWPIVGALAIIAAVVGDRHCVIHAMIRARRRPDRTIDVAEVLR